METSKHTPKPWTSTFTSDGARGVRDWGGFICFLPKPSRYSGQDERYEEELEENKANAQLIATSPELLEALKETRLYLLELESSWEFMGLLEMMDMVIAKAEPGWEG